MLDRIKSPYPSTQDPKYEIALREKVEGILVEGAPVLRLVSEADIRKLLDRPVGSYAVGGPWSARAVLERLIEFNTWVTEYDVRVEL